MAPKTMYDELGEERLRAIIAEFVDRIFDDVMIGFFFRHADRERIKAKEFEFAAAHLGGPVTYSGRPIDKAHRAHPIMGGQFMRRLHILKQVLEAHAVPEPIREHWLGHTEALRPLVTRDSGGRCDPDAAAQRSRPGSDEGGGRDGGEDA